MLTKTDNTKFNITYILFISAVSAIGGLLFGYDLLVISGAKQFYELHYGLDTPALQGWAVSSCIVGCIVGAIFVSRIADKFGRIKPLVLAAVLFLISAIGSGYAPTFTQFVVYRLLGGIAMGMASTLSPMYIAEVSPAKYRGRFVSLNQLTVVVGILLAQLVNYMIVNHQPVPDVIQKQCALSADLNVKSDLHKKGNFYDTDLFTEDQKNDIIKNDILKDVPNDVLDVAECKKMIMQSLPFAVDMIDLKKLKTYTNNKLSTTWNGTTGWRVMFAVEGIPAILFMLLLFFIPKSPRWLVKNGQDDQAYNVLEKIGGQAYATHTLSQIKSTMSEEQSQIGFIGALQPKYMAIIVSGVFIAVFQQWCGINVIFNYAPDIFRDAGFTVSGIMFSLVIIGLTNMVFTFVGMALIDRLGRKPLMIIGSAGLCVSHVLIGLCYFTGITGWYVVAFALLAIAFFAATLGPVAWVFISEIFPNAIRGVAMSIAVLSLWVACFILSFTFPILRDTLGPAGTFWTYAGICLIGVFYIKSKIIETKGKSLEEIEKELLASKA